MRRIEGGKERGRAIAVELDGDPLPAIEGEPLAVSLLAAGERTLSRSIKYHRPRGPYCFAAACSGCLMRVDGAPNVYTCRTPAREGMRLERQNAYPSPRVDVFHSIDWLFPRGMDHHAMFAGVPVAEKVMARVARHLAGLGLLPDRPAPERPPCQVLRTRVAIAGGGVSGLFAARRLAERKVPFLLFEREPVLGGRLALAPDGGAEPPLPPDRELPPGQVRPRSPVVGLFEDEAGRFLAVVSAPEGEVRLLKVYADRFLLAVGGHPPTLPFENNDLPGVHAGRAASAMLLRHGLLVAEKPVLVGRGPELKALARVLETHGARIAAVVDASGTDPEGAVAGKDLEAHGRSHVTALSFTRRGRRRKVACDGILVSVPVSPSFELARQGGARVSWSPPYQTFVVEASPEGRTHAPSLYVAGEQVGPMSREDSARSGERAADAIASEEGGGP